jgi:hypothetical protein
MQYINRIEKNEITTLDAARELKLTQRAVQMWMTKKAEIKSKYLKEQRNEFLRP